MEEYAVDVLPGEVIPWARSAARSESPEFSVRAFKEYQLEWDFDREDYGIGAGDGLSLATVTGRLTMTPAGGGDGWVLELRARESVGLLPADERGQRDDPDMSVEAFVQQFLVPEKGDVEVVLHADGDAAAEAFQRWLNRRRQA